MRTKGIKDAYEIYCELQDDSPEQEVFLTECIQNMDQGLKTELREIGGFEDEADFLHAYSFHHAIRFNELFIVNQ